MGQWCVVSLEWRWDHTYMGKVGETLVEEKTFELGLEDGVSQTVNCLQNIYVLPLIPQLPLQVSWDHVTGSDQWTKSGGDMSHFQVETIVPAPSALLCHSDCIQEKFALQSKDLGEPNLSIYVTNLRNQGLFNITAQVSQSNTEGQDT